MSKIGIISDIHGNYPALKAVLNQLDAMNCNQIICLGDSAGYYSMVNECVEELIQRNIYSLKGNHDSYLLGETQCPRSHSVNDCIAYQKKIIKPEYLEWFRNLKPTYTCADFYAMHGGFADPIDEYVRDFDFEEAKKHFTSKVFLSGHTHVQKLQQDGELVYCNPGSVGQPRDYDSRSAFAVLENGEIKTYRVSYDIDEIAENMKKAGFNDYYYRNLYEGCKIGESRQRE